MAAGGLSFGSWPAELELAVLATGGSSALLVCSSSGPGPGRPAVGSSEAFFRGFQVPPSRERGNPKRIWAAAQSPVTAV